MREYRVVASWSEQALCALRCSSGRYHLARALNLMPPKEAPLHGNRPRLGLSVLLCPASGAIFRLIFESINDAEPAPVIQQMLKRPPVKQWNGLSVEWSSD
jgi:hypothetical protein